MQAPIRVRAKPGVPVPVPRLRGGIAQYVNRSPNHDAIKEADRIGRTDWDKCYPIDAEPSEFSIETHGHDVMNEIRTALRHGDLLLELKAAPKTLAQETAMPKGKASQ